MSERSVRGRPRRAVAVGALVALAAVAGPASVAHAQSGSKATSTTAAKTSSKTASSKAAASTTSSSKAVTSTTSSSSNGSSKSSSGKSDNRWGDHAADGISLDTTGANYPVLDPGSLFTITTVTGARTVWHQKDAAGRAITGQGVTVALIDSGVAPVAGLNRAGQVVDGPDLSLETNSPALQDVDTFGHGTHLAGIIAAHDSVSTDATGAPALTTSPYSQLGIAPDAKILAIKLATTDGSTDVSQVIAALDWVVEHKNDNGMNVRVINLSFGTESTQPYQLDPLATAVENAWHHGVVVVDSAGNDGPTAVSLTDPAVDPYVIAVGASDPNESVIGWLKPGVAAYSSRGTADRHPDLLAPGRSIASLRDPGSFIDVNHPEGLVAGDKTGRLFRGSGTSQAAAVVSGAVALLLQDYPNLTPDQVKAALTSTATPIAGASTLDAGAGELNIAAALKAAATIGPSAQTWPVATGLGSLELARGGSHLVDPDTGAVLSGEVDVQGTPWQPAAWSAASAAGTAWSGGLWLGARWSGDGWSGASWTSSAWSGARWSGARWSDASWDGARWSGARWSDAAWAGARWSDRGWY